MSERDGVLVVDKTGGPTSHDVVAAVRRIFGMRRVGHCGTLDPMATGVLVVCLGAYTRLSDWISKGSKEYETVFFLGARSDTGDRQGQIVANPDQALPDFQAVVAGLDRFRGQIQQVPPAYSAVKVAGVRSYKLARRQLPVVLDARPVEIKSIEVLAFEAPRLSLRIRCSRGTYVRSLAVDLGEALGCGAYVEELRRLRVGDMGLEQAHTLGHLRELAEQDGLDGSLVPVQQALASLPALSLDLAESQVFTQGGAFQLGGRGIAAGECAVYGADRRLLGIGNVAGEGLRPLKVFVSQTALAEADSVR